MIRAVRWWLGVALLCLSCLALAQPVQRLVVPFPAGGSIDRVARMLAPELSAATGQTVVVDNRPGAEGAIAVDLVTRPDAGRALLLGNAFLAAGHATGRFRVDITSALAPVVQIGETQIFLVARPESSWPDGHALLAHLRSGRDWVSCAGAPGQPLQACELLARQFPGRVVAVPFQGEAQAIQAVAGKHVDISLVTRPAAYPLVLAGRLSLLAVWGEWPSKLEWTVPPLEALFPGLTLYAYSGVFVSASAFSADEILSLNRTINQILASERFSQALIAAHVRPVGGSPRTLEDLLDRNIQVQQAWQKKGL